MVNKSFVPNDIVVLQFEKPAKNDLTGKDVTTYNRIICVKNGKKDTNGRSLYTPLTNMNKINNFNNMANGAVYDALSILEKSEDVDPSYLVGRLNGELIAQAVDGKSGLPKDYNNISEFNLLFFYPGNNGTRPINLPVVNVNSDPANVLANKTMKDLSDGKNVFLDDLQLMQASFTYYDKIYNDFIMHESCMASIDEMVGPDQ